ncbi:hypothetical protein ARAM_000512 [Aspergillus rambellii]|uniref:Zn(2)-C6 fungal-type domain-containing protein n=1 Tax=Aspergillus rambellii TaxID=308745 RepID=A0A0F8WFH4_9EURO|nr:hypothetical protein ARAM_000512 [Aspergillus rambellii]
MSSAGTASPLFKRGKKACTECRQQKARCDAYLMSPGQACTRCQKMGSECIISDPFRREHKRQKLTDLEKETNELRKKLESSQTPTAQVASIAMLTAPTEIGYDEGEAGLASNINPSLPVTVATLNPPVLTDPNLLPPIAVAVSKPFIHNTAPTSLTAPYYPPSGPFPSWRIRLPPLLPPVGLGQIHPKKMDLAQGCREPEPTECRTLNNIQLTGGEIDEIFKLFFHQYAQFLPLLDPQVSPNAYYTQSPFLFWAIVGVACRTYPKNPTLMQALAKGIIEMALLSTVSPCAPWHSIQGILLVLTWPFPKENERSDAVFPLSGLLLHMAMQHGLHIPLSSHEFYKANLPAPSELDIIRRSELWAHCVIVYQRSCTIKGQLPRSLLDLARDLAPRQVLMGNIVPSLTLELKCQELVTRCSASVNEFSVLAMTQLHESLFDVLIRSYEDQAAELCLSQLSLNDRFHTALCRMSIQIFHLFKTHTLFANGCQQKLVLTTCNLISTIQAIVSFLESPGVCPNQLSFGNLLAGATLLRILKGPVCQDLDVERARAAFFNTITLARQMTTASNDVSAKTVIVLGQLWNSTKSFRKADGSPCTTLRIRSRLILSPVIDAMWWWRDEFDPQCHATANAHGTAAEGGVENNEENLGATGTTTGASDGQSFYLFDDQFLADFEWALADEALGPAGAGAGTGVGTGTGTGTGAEQAAV